MESKTNISEDANILLQELIRVYGSNFFEEESCLDLAEHNLDISRSQARENKKELLGANILLFDKVGNRTKIKINPIYVIKNNKSIITDIFIDNKKEEFIISLGESKEIVKFSDHRIDQSIDIDIDEKQSNELLNNTYSNIVNTWRITSSLRINQLEDLKNNISVIEQYCISRNVLPSKNSKNPIEVKMRRFMDNHYKDKGYIGDKIRILKDKYRRNHGGFRTTFSKSKEIHVHEGEE